MSPAQAPPVKELPLAGAETFVSDAVVGGRYLLSACIVNFHTAESDVDAIPEIVARIGRAVDGEMRRGA